ncbi:MAG TPA: hypothetical protein VLE74_02160 [Candidatus Saccharimonadales bacterium]|nr:hypothetical protein [Candidatus Saccharimonadales bacterium]
MAGAAAIAERLPTAERMATDVIVMPTMPEDQLAQQRAKRLMRANGSLAVAGELPKKSDQHPGISHNLLEGIRLAAAGDANGINMVDQNIEADYIERSFKAGSITEVDLRADGQNGLGQHGQSLDSVNGNSLRFVGRTWQMRERLQAEARNKYRQDIAQEMGLLEDNYFVVFSLVPDNMTQEELIEEDFFVDTMSCAMQATTAQEDSVKLESAFVAGVKRPGAERHDIKAVKYIAKKLGKNFDNMSTTQILDSPLLIPKKLMPNGVVDPVAWFDEPEGTFFGEDKPQQDYVKHREFWRQRQAGLKSMVEDIRRQLISERHTFKTPTDATKRLGKLSEKAGVRNAVDDKSINPNVFGPTAAGHIQQARTHRASGNYELADAALHNAEKTAKSSSCPGALQEEKNKDGQENTDEQSSDRLNDETDSKSGKIRCIKCRETVNKKDVVKEKSWRCPHCKYEVDICDGKVLHESKPPKREKSKAGSWAVGILKAA